MRIVGGRLKGRTLLTPSSRAIRPTSERLRESIFDILEHRFPGQIEGARVVDLFAGTGALAIEALSRGARFALLVDNGAEARALLRANVEALALGGVTRIWRADATRLGSAPAGGPFALAFLDPPYGQGLAGPALASLIGGGWLEPNALCVVEEAAKVEIAAPAGLARVDERTYGDTRIAIFQASAPNGDLMRPALSNGRDWATSQRRAKLPGREVNKSVATLGLFAALMLGGCQPLEVDQVAQQSMIGLRRRDILACFGQPTHRAPAGQATEIWTYTGGQMRGYGPQWAIVLNTNLPPFAAGGSCDVVLVMTNAHVSEVGYTAVDGEALPLGQECVFSVEACVKAP